MIETGKVLQNRYRIDNKIGQGGMGAVYVATDERFNSTVAIKETLLMDDNYRKAIEREARLLNSLKHSALPRVSDHFEEDHSQFLVMEYIPGDDLCCILEDQNKPFPVDTVLNWADQLLDALEFLHHQENPVIHRDIKPQNLKITPRGQIILLDFGLAKGNPTDAGNKTAAKSIFGYSRNYASLEQIQGTGTDPRSDLYSLAATLYHLMTNVAPEDALTRAMAVLNKRPDPLVPANKIEPSIPAGVAGVLQNALDLNASERPESAARMREMLQNYEEFAYLAENSAAAPPPIAENLFSQKTKLMPGATRHDTPVETEARTRVMPNDLSQVTKVRLTPEPTSSGRSSRMRFALYAFAGLVLCSVAVAGFYIYQPASAFDRNDVPIVEETAPAPVTNPEAAVAEASAAANSANSNIAANAVAAATPRSAPAQRQRSVSGPARAAVADEEPVMDGDTIYVGNMKIRDGVIEMPDFMVNSNSTTPSTPRVRTVPIPPGFMTPEQQRKLHILQNLRKPPPSPAPTPQN